MPDRIIRDWTDSEAVNSLTWQAECFFTRLIMKADDFGRYHGNPKLLKSLLFPLKDGLRDADITRWIAECVNAGMLVVYTDKVSGKPFLQIRNFGQRLRTRKAKFPDANGSYAIENLGDCQQVADICQQSAVSYGNVPPEEEVEEKMKKNTKFIPPNPPLQGGGENKKTTSSNYYPSTVDEVLAIAASPECGVMMTRETAEVYLMKRLTTDWIDGCGRKIKRVAYDIKQWALRDQQAQADKSKATATVEMPPDDTDEEFAKNYHGDI